MISKATRYFVQYAGTDGKRHFVGATVNGRMHLETQMDAAELFATFDDAECAADNIPPRNIIRNSLPTIRERKVLIRTTEHEALLPGLSQHR